MEKNGELKAGQSICDYCSERATTTHAGMAMCPKHAAQHNSQKKQASSGGPANLRSSAPELSGHFKE